MDRVTLRIPEEQVRRLERQVNRGEYPNRSEAIRDAVRERLRELESAEDGKPRPMNPKTGKYRKNRT